MTTTESNQNQNLTNPLTPYVRDTLIGLAAQSSNEVCGFVRYKYDCTGMKQVMIAHPMENVSNSPARFFAMDDEEMVEYYKNHLPRTIGMYHSHPSGSLKLSPADIENAPMFGRYFIVARGMVVEWDLSNRGKPVRLP